MNRMPDYSPDDRDSAIWGKPSSSSRAMAAGQADMATQGHPRIPVKVPWVKAQRAVPHTGKPKENHGKPSERKEGEPVE